MMKNTKIIIILLIGVLFFACDKNDEKQIAKIIDHNAAVLDKIPTEWINSAKEKLHIAYGHTSHGSQLITGMTGLMEWKGDLYKWNNGAMTGALDIRDQIMGGDLGHNGDLEWESATRSLLDDPRNDDINVVIWSWCGGVSDNTEGGINIYLDAMNQLEIDYPDVQFVYMTGHSDIWSDATVKASNQQIRDYCIANGKILYDFYDIERYDPDGTFFEFTNDDCGYYDGAGGNLLGNWANEWQNSHTEGVDWYDCSPAHTQALNGNLKAYAAWWLWCRIAGWEGTGIKNIAEKEMKIYPNPVNDILKFETERKIQTVKLFTVSGKLVMQFVNFPKNEINVSRLTPGIYFLKTYFKTGNKIIRFIKQ